VTPDETLFLAVNYESFNFAANILIFPSGMNIALPAFRNEQLFYVLNPICLNGFADPVFVKRMSSRGEL
jgi:hypothetical protein